jgi:hypothetical protein
MDDYFCFTSPSSIKILRALGGKSKKYPVNPVDPVE